ncbi:MAG TPA: T9SS type A sorting domain-containing protein [Flavitalea sp.]|nr:T9SS type A sorting domain-containing protein [Flavitalea sp.]
MITFNSIHGVVKFTTLLIVMFCIVSHASASITTDTILIQKNNKVKTHRISLYPDANQKVVFFSVRGIEGEVYQLYVFDLEGKLIRQTETRNKQTTILKNIQKGAYVFEVFSDDRRIGNGQIAIR